MISPCTKFQDLLKKLFQFDCAELDFGIYRIMNHKRVVIEQFIEKDLLSAVAMELSTGAIAQETGLTQQLEEVAAQIRENFGDEALDAEGNLDEQYQKTPKGKQYVELRAKAGTAKSRPQREAEVFNHLYTFFSRYYDEGDFMSLRRYSRRDKYAIPYNGEEVHLHWANSDQYYIKTGENFTDYSYRHGGWTVRFKLRTADVEQNNVKGAKRFFVPRATETELDEQSHTLSVPFEFRPLTSEEEKTFGKNKAQEAILEAAEGEITKAAKKNPDALAALLHEKRKDSNGNPVGLLSHHLRTYARKNSSDFFIHKDLKGFLERELDFYLKNEVLNLDELEAGGEARADGWFQLMRTIKAIGLKIIAFVAQIEEFQKRLFEKKKFVTEVNYCVTLDRVPEDLYPEIVKNQAQIEEWKRLFHIQEIKATKLGEVDYTEPLTVEFLKANPFLVVDTKFFKSEFNERLLSSFADIGNITDGALLHGDNLHALRLLHGTHKTSVDAVYADPPYNTSASEIIYKNSYKHSSWLCLMADRLRQSRTLMKDTAISCVTIDDFEVTYLTSLLTSIFGEENHLATAVIRSKPQGRATAVGFSPNHEYGIFFANSEHADVGRIPRDEDKAARYKEKDALGIFTWANFRGTGANSFRKDRLKLYYPMYVSNNGDLRVPSMNWDEEAKEWQPTDKLHKGEQIVWPVDDDGTERVWTLGWDRAQQETDELQAKEVGGRWQVYRKYRPNQDGALPGTWWDSSLYSASESGTKILQKLFGGSGDFSYPKSLYAVIDCLRSANLPSNGVALDFFGGSGTTAHAAISLNREDSGSRKYILVEMGEYFDTILKPRIQKVIYSKDWNDGKPVSREGSSHLFKYLRLESYEDALDNITFQPMAEQTALQFDDYVLSYMLDFETKESDTLLNVAKLDSPFDYTLRLHGKDEPLPVDLPETFNYLIGLHVATRRVYTNGGIKYLVYRGTAEGRQTAIIWRTTRGWGEKEFEADRQFILKEKLTDGAEEVYVNADSFLEGARSLDPVFKRRMFNGE